MPSNFIYLQLWTNVILKFIISSKLINSAVDNFTEDVYIYIMTSQKPSQLSTATTTPQEVSEQPDGFKSI